MKEKEGHLKRLSLLKDVSTPATGFTFFWFKDTLKVEDFGGIQEASYRLPNPLEFLNPL